MAATLNSWEISYFLEIIMQTCRLEAAQSRRIKKFREYFNVRLKIKNHFVCRRWLWILFIYENNLQQKVLAHRLNLNFLNMHLVQMFWITLQHGSLGRMLYCTLFAPKLEYGHKYFCYIFHASFSLFASMIRLAACCQIFEHGYYVRRKQCGTLLLLLLRKSRKLLFWKAKIEYFHYIE